MFHFDPADYLCPTYLQRNAEQTYNFRFVPEKNTNKAPVMKFSATSA
jgi:hypothetical protein